MAWTTPRTWVDGELVDDTIMNAHVRDNLDYLKGVVIGTRVYRTTAQTITTNTNTAIGMDAEVVDDGGWHSTVTNNSRITVPTAGWYAVSGGASWNFSGTTGTRYGYLRVNGSTYIARDSDLGTTGGYGRFSNPNSVAYLSANDYVELVVYHAYGSDLDVNGSTDTYLSVVRLS